MIQDVFGRKKEEMKGFCVSMVKYLVLVNRIPTGFFAGTKELKEGVHYLSYYSFRPWKH